MKKRMISMASGDGKTYLFDEDTLEKWEVVEGTIFENNVSRNGEWELVK